MELLIGYCEVNTELAAKVGVSFFGLLQKANIWFTVYFTGSVEFTSLVCSSGMDGSSACLRLVF